MTIEQHSTCVYDLVPNRNYKFFGLPTCSRYLKMPLRPITIGIIVLGLWNYDIGIMVEGLLGNLAICCITKKAHVFSHHTFID
jgi:hypothetical protein